ncbi:hypothetical protein [Streptomyces sp. KLOTTS4A1]|uniref:hypothetical protein n=1 Tax=Streptomyces sp. KLOTTS4A1 TaxID=3390996 RepID=UPI0039F4D3F7
MGMALSSNDLLPGEAVEFAKKANSVVKVAEAGLTRFSRDQLTWMVRMQGSEAIGGQLHVTNYRLVFCSHFANRVIGRFSIFLPVISGVRDTSWGIKRQIEVSTGTHRFTFVVWGIPALMAAIEGLRRHWHPEQAAWLAETATAEYAKLGEGLLPRPSQALRSDMSPIEFVGAMGLMELQDLARGA